MTDHRAGWKIWVLLGLLSLSARASFEWISPAPSDGDQLAYLELAASLAGGAGYETKSVAQTTIHPLLPALHAMGRFAWGGEPRGARLLSLLIGSLLPVVAGLTIHRLLGRLSWGLGAGLLLCLQPHLIVRSSRVEPDLLAATMMFWLSSLAFRRDWAMAGAVAGLAYLNRPEAIVILPCLLAVAVWRKAGLRGAAALLVACASLAAPFVLFVHAETGRWALSGKDQLGYRLGVHQYRTGGRPIDPAGLAALSREVPSISGHLRANPREALFGYLSRWGTLLRNLAIQLGFVLIPAALYGIRAAWRRSPEAAACLALPLALVPVLPVVFTGLRHSLVPGSLLVAFAGIGAADLIQRLLGKRATSPQATRASSEVSFSE